MKIGISIPDFSAHGGINVIIEWANRLNSIVGNKVTLFSMNKIVNRHWMPVTCEVKKGPTGIDKMDIFIITSPHTVHWHNFLKTKKVFCFVQNIEHLFRPHDEAWGDKCSEFYNLECDKFYLADWNLKYMHHGETHKVRNCANFDLFKWQKKERKSQVLIEGIIPTNPTKDIYYLGLNFAKKLHKNGIKVVSYGQLPFKSPYVEYYQKPNLEILNKLYNESNVFYKASMLDAMSTAPIEAGACMLPVVRFIQFGDDNLIRHFNCLKYEYLLEKFITYQYFEEDYNKFAENHYNELNILTWEKEIKKINTILHG